MRPPVNPAGWYALAASSELRAGGVLPRRLAGRPVVLYRGLSGRPACLSAHCSHLGTHLGRGVVVGDRIRCPMHHWEYDSAGICRRVPASSDVPETACQFSFPTVERLDTVFAYNGAHAPPVAPYFDLEGQGGVRTIRGRTVHLLCPPHAVMANAFDIQHLQMVHDRTLAEPPRVTRPDPSRIQLRYVSRVLGRAPQDRVMRALSRNRVDVRITAWGAGILTVESDLGRVRSALLLGFQPVGDDGEAAEVSPLFALRKGPSRVLDRMALLTARWLFMGFLRHDISLMDRMRFQPRLLLPQDEVLGQYLEFLSSLPAGAPAPASPALAAASRT